MKKLKKYLEYKIKVIKKYMEITQSELKEFEDMLRELEDET